uniref:Rab GTPase-binding effector protein 2 n=1 Tax=Poecilia latipinna TaxID=48699 RepID=A0A3B3UQZ5_9TELE
TKPSPSYKMTEADFRNLASLQAQLAEYQAQAEHWQGVATICELSKQEELAELQKQCDEEIQSLQEALRETAAQYEARIAVLQSQPVDWRRTAPAVNSSKEDEGASPADQTRSRPAESETAAEGEGSPLSAEGYFSLQNCDSASLSSFSLDMPSLPRKLLAQDDTDSLVSTGTLVPEAIYLPPAGHRLVTHSDWDAMNAQLSELRGEVSRLQAEKEELERELDTHTHQTHKQVSLLQSQVQASETLLQDLQKSFSQSQSAVQSRLAELSLSQRKMCCELSRLKGEEVDESLPDSMSSLSSGAHCEERLRIEIVNLREQLDSRTEENVQLSTLRTETEKIQAQRDQLQAQLLSCRSELDALRVALTHLQSSNKGLVHDKAVLHQQCLELRSQVISLRSQVDTSQTVQRDFVELSQSLQVKLELIRQAESLEQVKEILGESVGEAEAQPADAS